MSRRRRPTATPTATPELSPVESERAALGRVRHTREGRDRERGLLARAEREVNLAAQRREEAIDAELQQDSASARDATRMAEKALADARGRLESAQARAERAQLAFDKADKYVKRVRREHAVELGREMEPQVEELRELISSVEEPLRQIIAKWSSIEGAFSRLYPGLADHIVRADAADGRSRDADRVRREARTPTCPLDPALLSQLLGTIPRPWVLDERYVPDTEPPVVEVPANETRHIFQGDPEFQRHVHPAANSGEPTPSPVWPPSHVKSPGELMAAELQALARMT